MFKLQNVIFSYVRENYYWYTFVNFKENINLLIFILKQNKMLSTKS